MNHTVQTVAADKWSTTQNNAANGNDANAAHATTADAEANALAAAIQTATKMQLRTSKSRVHSLLNWKENCMKYYCCCFC